MANEQNLKPAAHPLTVEEQSKGGKASGKARKRKADLRRMAQEVLDGTFKDKHGKEFTGEEAVIQGLVANLADPKGKNWGKAMDLLVELLGAKQSREEKQQIKAQTALIKAKAELLNVSDDSVLEKLDDVLKQIGE